MSKKAPRARVERRERKREMIRATERMEKLAEELPGATRERPLTVASASVIDVRARTARCLRCDGELEPRGDDHATAPSGALLRRVDLVCRLCHAPRAIWFQVAPSLPS
jgi:hypothetical protein